METSSIQLQVNGLKDTGGQAVQNTETWLSCTNTKPDIFMLDRAALNQSVKAQFSFSIETEFSPTLMAKGPGGGTRFAYLFGGGLLGDE